MEVGGTKNPPEVDHHWVEKLFPPHFTFEDLLEGKFTRTKEAKIRSVKLVALDVPPDSAESRRQIYVDVLRKEQEKEEKIKRSNLAKNISRDAQFRGDVENKASCETVSPDCSGKTNGGRCIWNEKDLSKLRTAQHELERDRWRLGEQLRSSEQRLKIEQEEWRRLEELLNERQKQLDCSKKEAARHALVVKALKREVHEKDVRLQNLTKQRQEKADDMDKLRVELRRTRDGYRHMKEECSDMACQLEKIKVEQKMEVVRQMEEARLEHQVAKLRLQKEVQDACAQLRAEKENHGRSLTALELLRRHFNNQGLAQGQ